MNDKITNNNTNYMKNSDIGKYISNQPILSFSVYVILNTANGACDIHDYPIIQIEK
jgi:hypothetical protein